MLICFQVSSSQEIEEHGIRANIFKVLGMLFMLTNFTLFHLVSFHFLCGRFSRNDPWQKTVMVLLWLRPSGCRMHVPGSMDISYMALRIPNGTFSGVDASLALVTAFPGGYTLRNRC